MNPPQTQRQVAARLNSIVVKRNRMVHEGYYEQVDRPRQPRMDPMGVPEAAADLDYLETLIDAIQLVPGAS